MPKANSRYRAEKVMSRFLGLTPVPFSGSRMEAKEDGECEHFLMQHKSTNGSALRVQAWDIQTLLAHALVTHKAPLFVLDFLREVVLRSGESPSVQVVCIPFTQVIDIDRFCEQWQAHRLACLVSEGSNV